MAHRDRLAVPESNDQDKLNELAGKTYPEILEAAIEGNQLRQAQKTNAQRPI